MRDTGKILKQDFKTNAFYIHFYKYGDSKPYKSLKLICQFRNFYTDKIFYYFRVGKFFYFVLPML
jgi:hypothetical protein